MRRKPPSPKEEGIPVYRKEKAAGVGGPQRNVRAGAGMDRIQESPRRMGLVSLGLSSVTAWMFVSHQGWESIKRADMQKDHSCPVAGVINPGYQKPQVSLKPWGC